MISGSARLTPVSLSDLRAQPFSIQAI